MDRDFTGLNKDEIIALLLEENAQLNNSVTSLTKNVTSLTQNVETLSNDVKVLKRYLYGKKNEKVTTEDKRQGVLFDELEETLYSEEEQDKETPKATKPSGKRGRKPLPKDIPRERTTFDVKENDKLCPCCNKKRPEISSTPTEELQFIPARIIVKEYEIKKYGACTCVDFQSREDLPQVVEAKAPKRFMPGGIASPSLVSHILTNKFTDALPFYRQNKIFKRIGVDISRQNMSNWALAASRKCEILIEHMRKYLINGKLINMDETTLQVLNEKGRSAQSKSYMWVMAGGENGKKIVLFNYAPTRKQETPLKLLEGYNGILQTDGYAGYNKAVKEYGLTHIGCLAHARRKFWELAEKSERVGRAHKGVSFFSKLYDVNNSLKRRGLSEEEFLKKRREKSIPVWQEFYTWLHENKNRVAPGSPISKAIQYSINQYKSLVKYLKYADVQPNNNIAKNAIRPFCIGRKNWLFNNTPRGAYSSAILYSLVETARINDIAPDFYFNYIFTELTEKGESINLDSLMPWNIVSEPK